MCIHSWLVIYTQNVEKIKLRISREIIMHNIQLRNTRKLFRKTLLFLVFTVHFSFLQLVWNAVSRQDSERAKRPEESSLGEKKKKKEAEAISLFLFPPLLGKQEKQAAEPDFLHSAT